MQEFTLGPLSESQLVPGGLQLVGHAANYVWLRAYGIAIPTTFWHLQIIVLRSHYYFVLCYYNIITSKHTPRVDRAVCCNNHAVTSHATGGNRSNCYTFKACNTMSAPQVTSTRTFRCTVTRIQYMWRYNKMDYTTVWRKEATPNIMLVAERRRHTVDFRV